MTLLRAGALRFRLTLLAAFAISALLAVAGVAFSYLFEVHVQRFVVGELNTHFQQLASGLAYDTDGKLRNRAVMSDPRFAQPQGGMYWQVDEVGQPSLRSRSMWDESFSVPTPPTAPEEDHAHVMPGPGGKDVLALEKLIFVTDRSGVDHRLVVTIGMEKARVQGTISNFGKPMIAGLAVLYFTLLASVLLIIFLGMRPLKMLRESVEALRMGKATRVGGEHPEEVAPLVNEVNALVEAREKQLERARQRAGNLAHGLKTPLTVLTATATQLAVSGQTERSSQIRLAVDQMRDLVDRELARSRMAAGASSHRSPLLPAVERVVETCRRAPRGEDITWAVDVPPRTQIAIDGTDLLELLGNLIDNARKHAQSEVRVTHDGRYLVVEDDGPGVAPDKLATITRRGVKLDALSPGSGLGLSIVSDLAEVYDFELAFEKSSLGGLKASVGLPALT
ncbi:sensor histidine kinase [Aestuariivirga sp.]|uniref:sensor histidine kinase n=1 Tax=Aestuariivirga sp. TaxID=2650926 RepID=UPI0039E61748